MEILKGMVQDEGYPNEECTYAKVDDKTLYYFIKDYQLPNGNIIANTNLKEAIGHAPYTSLGVIDKDGKILIPFENKMIKPIQDNLLLVERNVPTNENVLSALKSKSDPFTAQTLAQNAATIKKQLQDIMGMNAGFIFDNQFSEAALYTMDGLNVANNYFSFIGENNGDYYFATSVVGDTIMKFNPSQLEQNNQPVEEPPSTTNNEQLNSNMENNLPTEQNQEPPIPQVDVSSATGSESLENTQVVENNQTGDIPKEEDLPNTPNIDIPLQNMSENNQVNDMPPIVNTEDTDLPKEETKEEQPEENGGNQEEVKLNIAEENNLTNSNDEDIENEKDTQVSENTQEENASEPSTETSDDAFDEADEEEVDETDENDSDQDTSLDEEETEDEISDQDEEIETEEEVDEDNEIEDNDKEESVENSTIDENESQNQSMTPYSLTDEDIATPTIKDATNTIKKLLEENRKQRQIIDKQIGEIEALKASVELLTETNYSNEQEVQMVREEMNNYRTQSVNLTRENTKLKGHLSRQSSVMETMNHQNNILRNQVAGMKALSDAVAEANMLVQPVDNDDNAYQNTYNNTIDIDKYLNGNYQKSKSA